eukprot:3170113-Prorocentrum_lima.AAC.1
MTSSLVGSEMCIRDRATTRTGPDGTLTNNTPINHKTMESYATIGTLSYRCLLYTSDAADDM